MQKASACPQEQIPMRRLITFVICLLISTSLFARKHRSRGNTHRKTRHHYVRKSAQKIEHDTLSVPLTIADSIIYEAGRHLGKPYCSGNKGPYAFDCSGFTSYVYSQFGFHIGASSRDQWLQGVKISTDHVHKGDLVFFTGHSRGGIGHVGIVWDVNADNHSFRFIHAATSGGIRIDRYPDAYYYSRRYRGLRRIVSYNDTPMPISEALTFDNDIADANIELNEKKENAINLSASQVDNFHKVKRGETIYSIAKKYKCSFSQLRKWNNLKAKSRLRVGQTLRIRETRGKDVKQLLRESEHNIINPEAANTKIIVEPNDNIYALSQKYHCTVRELMEWNHLRTNKLEAGQELIMRPEQTAATKDKMSNGATVHTVDAHENQYSIARRYHCTVDSLRSWNNLKDSRLAIGQKLIVRPKAPYKTGVPDNGSTHTVIKGETLTKIASDFKVQKADLVKWNHLNSSNIRAGQIIRIKGGEDGYISPKVYTDKKKETTTAPEKTEEVEPVKELTQEATQTALAPAVAPKATPKTNQPKHLVNRTPAKVNNEPKENATPKVQQPTKKAEEAAPIENTEKQATEEANLPKEVKYHTVKKGESIFRIAHSYHIATAKLKSWNKLSNNYPAEGTQIRLSAPDK